MHNSYKVCVVIEHNIITARRQYCDKNIFCIGQIILVCTIAAYRTDFCKDVYEKGNNNNKISQKLLRSSWMCLDNKF